jgi:hypothetical protein
LNNSRESRLELVRDKKNYKKKEGVSGLEFRV